MAAVAVCLLPACGVDAASQGDCNARIRYDGTLYRPHQDLRQDAPAGRAIGTGEVVGCGNGESAPTVDEVTVLRVKGVKSSVAVVVSEQDWQGIYVAEDLPRGEWPRRLEAGAG